MALVNPTNRGGIFIPTSPLEVDVDVDQILSLERGDMLPEGTFSIYEQYDPYYWHKFMFYAISKHAYPPVDPTTQRMTVLTDGASVTTERIRLNPFVNPVKTETYENSNGKILRNGHSVSLWRAKWNNPFAVD